MTFLLVAKPALFLAFKSHNRNVTLKMLDKNGVMCYTGYVERLDVRVSGS